MIRNRIKIALPAGVCRIHGLLLCGVVRLPNECPGYDTKQFDSGAQVMFELVGTRSIPSLPSLLGPLWLRVVALDRVLLMLNRIVLNRTVFDIETLLTLN